MEEVSGKMAEVVFILHFPPDSYWGPIFHFPFF